MITEEEKRKWDFKSLCLKIELKKKSKSEKLKTYKLEWINIVLWMMQCYIKLLLPRWSIQTDRFSTFLTLNFFFNFIFRLKLLKSHFRFSSSVVIEYFNIALRTIQCYITTAAASWSIQPHNFSTSDIIFFSHHSIQERIIQDWIICGEVC